MRLSRRRTLAPTIGLAIVLLPVPLLAQGGFVTFEFNFSNPGARSLGFGGAFVALADDATAAFANPAGLVQLLEPEVSLEARAWRYSTPYTRGGRLSGEPSGFGIDTRVGLEEAESRQTVTGLSFGSFVYPGKGWGLAVFHHQLATFRFAGETQGLFALPHPPDTGFRRENDLRLSTEYDFSSTGVSLGWRLGDELSVGLGLLHFDLALASREERFSFDSFERFFEPNSFLPSRNTQNLDFAIDENDWGLTGGFLWRASRSWSLAGAYREGPDADHFEIVIRSGAANPDLPAGTLLERVTTPIEFPDVLAVGAAFRSADDRLTVSWEWDRIGYSRILENMDFENEASIDDADELHLGAEYVFMARRPVVALRGGLWMDPDHRLRVSGESDLDRALFRGGEDELHLSVGLGLAWRDLQLDLGVDLSDPVETVSLSTIYRW